MPLAFGWGLFYAKEQHRTLLIFSVLLRGCPEWIVSQKAN